MPAEPFALAIAGGALGTCAALATRRGLRGALGFTLFYAPQVAILCWMGEALLAWRQPLAELAAGALLVGWMLVLLHRLTTYVFPLPPLRFDLAWFVPVHVFQTAVLLWLLFWPLSRLAPPSLHRDLLAVAIPLLVSAVLLIRTHRAPELRSEQLAVDGLSHPLRLVQVSDLHVGPYMGERRLRRLANEINAMRPELLAFTGDLLTLRAECDYSPLLRFIERLERPRYGMFGCLGNHDLAVAPQLIADLAARGLRILVDESERIVLEGGGAVRVVGLNWQRRSERGNYAAALQRALPANGSEAAILLCHDPGAFDHLGSSWRGVMLAGHLHGGQIGFNALGWPTSVLRPFGLYDQGAFRNGPRVLYAHRGTGVYGLPVRIGVPAEVVELRLAPQSASSQP